MDSTTKFSRKSRKPETIEEQAYMKAHPVAWLGDSKSPLVNFDPACKKCSSAKAQIDAAVEHRTELPLLPLINKCVAAGGGLALFPLMKYWYRTTLLALLEEIDLSEVYAIKAWEKLALEPQYFLNKRGQESLD